MLKKLNTPGLVKEVVRELDGMYDGLLIKEILEATRKVIIKSILENDEIQISLLDLIDIYVEQYEEDNQLTIEAKPCFKTIVKNKEAPDIGVEFI